MYLQTVTRISQLGLGQPVVLWQHPGGLEPDLNPLCLVVARVYDAPGLASWTARTAVLQLRHGGFTAEVRQENLVSPHQVPWHQVSARDAELVEQRRLLWRRVALAACTWCPAVSQSPAALLTIKGHPVCADHGRALLANPTTSHRTEWAADSVAQVYAELGLA